MDIKFDELGTKSDYVYYYLPKSGIFGNAKWQKYRRGAREVLSKFKWANYKKAFMPSNSGELFPSTTSTYQSYYLDEIPQYEDILTNKLDSEGNPIKDDNGNNIKEVSNKVHFEVVALDDNLTKIKFKAKDSGYFRFNDSEQDSSWDYTKEGSDINQSTGYTDSVKTSNIIYFLSEKPSYERYEDFPEWLNPKPILYNKDYQVIPENDTNINAKYIDFVINSDNWYRYTYPDTVSNDTKNTPWVYKYKDNMLYISKDGDKDIPKTSSSTSFTVNMIEMENTSDGKLPIPEYKYTDENGETIDNIGFFYINQNGEEVNYPNNEPPSWLKVTINKGLEDGSGTVLNFKAAENGLFKWDTNTIWQKKIANSSNEQSDIVVSSYTDDTSIYYLEKLPEYILSDNEPYEIRINENVITGNPDSIKVMIKKGHSGYYKAKNSTNWVFYNENDELCESKVTESTSVYHLIPNGSIDDVIINIIPRWWKL